MPATPYTPLQLQFASATDIEAMSSPSAHLIGAASDGDKKLVQRLLKEEKMDVNVRHWDKLTPLILASSAGHLDVVKLLLKEGADINAPSHCMEKHLSKACQTYEATRCWFSFWFLFSTL